MGPAEHRTLIDAMSSSSTSAFKKPPRILLHVPPLSELTPFIDGRNRMASRRQHQLRASAVEERRGADEERAGARAISKNSGRCALE